MSGTVESASEAEYLHDVLARACTELYVRLRGLVAGDNAPSVALGLPGLDTLSKVYGSMVLQTGVPHAWHRALEHGGEEGDGEAEAAPAPGIAYKPVDRVCRVWLHAVDRVVGDKLAATPHRDCEFFACAAVSHRQSPPPRSPLTNSPGAFPNGAKPSSSDRAGYDSTVRDLVQTRFRSAVCADELDRTPRVGGSPIGMMCDLLVPPGTDAVVRETSVARHLLERASARVLGLRDMVYHDAAMAAVVRASEVIRRPFGHALLLGPPDSGQAAAARAATGLHNGVFYEVRAPASGSLPAFAGSLGEILAEAWSSQRTFVLFVHDEPPLTPEMLSALGTAMDTGFVEGHVGAFLQSSDIGSAMSSASLPQAAAGPQVVDRAAAAKRAAAAVLVHTHTVAPQNVHLFFAVQHHAASPQRLAAVGRAAPRIPSVAAHIHFGVLQEADVAFVAQKTLERLLPRDVHRRFFGHTDETPSRAASLVARLFVRARQDLPAGAGLALGNGALRECLALCSQLFARQLTRMQQGLGRARRLTRLIGSGSSIIASFEQQVAALGSQRLAEEAELARRRLAAEATADQLRGAELSRQEAEQSLLTLDGPIKELEARAEGEAAVARPQFEVAVKDLDKLRVDDLVELRGYRNPPASVLLAVQPICLLFRGRFKHKFAELPKGVESPTWEEAKLLLNKDSFISDLQSFKKDRISEKVLAAIKKITKAGSYDPAKLGTASLACRYLSQWVLAVVAYAEVVVACRPTLRRLQAARELRDRVNDGLSSAKGNLDGLRAQVHASTEQVVAQEKGAWCRPVCWQGSRHQRCHPSLPLVARQLRVHTHASVSPHNVRLYVQITPLRAVGPAAF